jgi:glycosyltransferase involved in cell wall biosynthesis
LRHFPVQPSANGAMSLPIRLNEYTPPSMHSTRKNTTTKAPTRNESGIVGRYLSYPDETGKRVAHGGIRIQGVFKHSLLDLPLVTIITVCMNSAKTLEQCIQSVLDQTYPNIEYIIIDACSADGTLDLIKKHEDSIDYYLSEPDRGLYHAMNKGLELSSGDYILILNSDDWYKTDCVEALILAKRTSNACFVSARAQNVNQEGLPLQVIRSMPYDAGLRLRMPLRHETMLLSADIYNNIGLYDESYKIISDFHLTLRVFEGGYSHYEVPKHLMFFRNTGVSSINLDKLYNERIKLLSWQFPFMSDADIRVLAEHGKLDQINIREIVSKYRSYTKLIEALRAFVLDQKNVGSIRWKNFDASIFEGIKTTTSELIKPIRDKKTLKVATFCSMDHGGAGVGTQRRVEALRNYGVDAQIFSLVTTSSHSYVHKVIPKIIGIDNKNQNEVWGEVRKRAIRPARETPGFRARELFSLTDSVVDYQNLKELFESFDIIHLHWVVGMLNYDQIGDFLAEKPVIWTLADMNAFTGGCHYSEYCLQYQQSCEKCHLLGAQSLLAHNTWKIKKLAYQKLINLHIICPSKWLYTRVLESSLLGDRNVHYIPNAFPIDRYVPTNKVVARIRLGLPINKKLLLFGAESLKNERKGGHILEKAITLLIKNKQKNQDIEIVVFGSASIQFSVPVHSLGHISDDHALALAYSAVNVFLSPSLEDSGPMTVGEALCCGTPVVAFNVGYAPDIIEHGVTGFIAKNFDPADFANGIAWALAIEQQEVITTGIKCRISASAFHSPELSVERHLQVYQSAISYSTHEHAKC